MREKYFVLVVSFQRPSDLIAPGRPSVCRREKPIPKTNVGQKSCCLMALGRPAQIQPLGTLKTQEIANQISFSISIAVAM